MTYGEREPLGSRGDHDASSLVFGLDDENGVDGDEGGYDPNYGHYPPPAGYQRAAHGQPGYGQPGYGQPGYGQAPGHAGAGDAPRPRPYPPVSRSDRRRDERAGQRRRGRRGRWIALLALGIVAVIAAIVVPWVISSFQVANYSGPGSGSVKVSIPSGASASQIAGILKQAGVVASSEAFTDAANANPASTGIQPGTYILKSHMSGKEAVTALLNPATRDAAADVVVTEGATSLDVAARLAQVLGASQKAAIAKALAHAADLGLPSSYGKLPNSAEGFLYPATYTFDPGTSAQTALETMVSRYIEEDRATGFTPDAVKAGLTPYQALIVASIAQEEAKYPADMAKVARVILNRLKLHMPLQIDATSAYAAKVNGVDPTKVTYSTYGGAYNSYQHQGLPPTPIGNPGNEAMQAAVHATAGNWLYYVNDDAAGHLFFTNSQSGFEQAVAKCRANHWGCA